MNVKIRLTILFAQLFTANVFAQDWNTSLNSIPPGGPHMLGSTNCAPLDIYTRNQLRFTIDTNGVLRSTHLAGTGSSFLRVTGDGSFVRAEEPTGDTWECNGQIPWVRGGNTVGGVYSGNFIGTCDNYDFILKAYNKRALFIKAANSYIGIGQNNSNPSAQLDIADLAGNSNHTRIYGDATGAIESTTDLSLIHNGKLSARFGNYSSSTLGFEVDGGGNAGIGGSSSLNWRMLVNAGTVDGIRAEANTASRKGLQVYSTSNSKEVFNVFGDGKTVIGDESGASNSAKFNINLLTGNPALNVFNATDAKNVFAVLDNGTTIVGNETGAPVAARLNVNMNNNDAINVFDAHAATNSSVFKVQAQGKTIVGDPKQLTNTATLSINGTTGQLFHINDHANQNGTKLVFKVEDQGKTSIGGDVNAPNAAFVNINVNTSSGLTNVLDIFDGGSGSQGMVKVRIKANGNIFCREINVIPQAMQVPDYVFDEQYPLKTINELENYLKENKHLPNVPPARELEKNGMGLMDMQLTQLEKIEEAFLYIIQLKNENQLLRERIEKLEMTK